MLIKLHNLKLFTTCLKIHVHYVGFWKIWYFFEPINWCIIFKIFFFLIQFLEYEP